jgi:hypothetical protein
MAFSDSISYQKHSLNVSPITYGPHPQIKKKKSTLSESQNYPLFPHFLSSAKP